MKICLQLFLLFLPLVHLNKTLPSSNLTGQSLILSQYKTTRNEILLKAISMLARFNRTSNFDLFPSLIINFVNVNDTLSIQRYQYQKFVINAILRNYAFYHLQYIVIDQCHHVRDKLYKMQAILIFVDGVDEFL